MLLMTNRRCYGLILVPRERHHPSCLPQFAWVMLVYPSPLAELQQLHQSLWISSDFSVVLIKDGKTSHTLSDGNTLNCVCVCVREMQPLASQQIHNTNPLSTLTTIIAGRSEMRPQCVSVPSVWTILKSLSYVWEQRRSSLFKRKQWWTPTWHVVLMICVDVQLEWTLQSDMDHWVHKSSSEVTRERLSSLSASPPSSVALKSNQKELYWHQWELEECRASFPLNVTIPQGINRITCTDVH